MLHKSGHFMGKITYAWVYLSRARICDRLTYLSDSTRWSLWWEAITYVEQAILLGEQGPNTWALLSQFHRSLNNEANALHIHCMLLDTEPEDLDILGEQAAILAKIGEFAEAEKAIDNYLDKTQDYSQNYFGEYVKAYILLYENHYEEALNYLNSVLEENSGDIGTRDLRASCYLLLDSPSQAVEDYLHIWNNYSPDDSKQAHFYATAAYNIGEIGKAINIVQERLDDPSWEAGKASSSLGLYYLAQRELEKGEDLLRRGIEQMTNKRQLDDISRDFVQIKKRSLSWSSIDQSRLQDGLNRLKKDIEMQRDKIKRPPTPEDELKQVIKKYPQDSDMGSRAWIGAQAALARMYSKEKRWAEAAKTYQLLLQFFPEARIGLAQALDNLQSGQYDCFIEHEK